MNWKALAKTILAVLIMFAIAVGIVYASIKVPAIYLSFFIVIGLFVLIIIFMAMVIYALYIYFKDK